MTRRSAQAGLLTLIAIVFAAAGSPALEPPTEEQLERYRSDGTLTDRARAARAFGNHRLAPALASRFRGDGAAKAQPAGPKLLPADGAPEVLTLLVAFEDMPGHTDAAVVRDRVFGDGEPAAFPYESLSAFYRRSSYGRLELDGDVLGWYTTPYPRDSVAESFAGRQNLIKEVMTHYDAEGHDFSRYDNDGDGVIDYLAVIWTGPHGEWADFWWGYLTSFWNDDFTVDGVRIGTYSWQWESYDWPGEFTPNVLIHETGHALGLPDYYDYDDGIGPRGGVGGLDQMDGNWGDHNAFSKWVLGWLEPEVLNQDSHQRLLSPSDGEPDALVVMHGDPMTDPYGECFMVQVRHREGNDAELPTDGLLIWHVDARLDQNGSFLYDNSYTEHKLLRLMEADGLEEIEQGGRADAGDFYTPGDLFDSATVPSSHRYDGVPTNIAIDTITEAGVRFGLQADLGSGCALWCDATVSATAWPGVPAIFKGSLDTANCDGDPAYGWVFGDGATTGETSASHAYVSAGLYDWNVTATLEDATCSHQGTVRVCTDVGCWQWRDAPAMAFPRAEHDAVALDDGRVLVVGGAERAEIYDPRRGTWSLAAPSNDPVSAPRAVRLADGRVLVVDSHDGTDGSDTEVYDPISDSWTVTGGLEHDRYLHSAAALSDGRVLVVGGISSAQPQHGAVQELEVWDPATGTWSVVGTLPGSRVRPGMVPLPDGRMLVVGGRSADIFDPISETLSRATPLPAEWQFPVAAALDDGRVLLCGVANDGLTLIWDPATDRLTLAGRHTGFRQGATAARLAGGLVLVAGGFDASGRAVATSELFDPTTLDWSEGSSLIEGRAFHAMTRLGVERLLVTGGTDSLSAPSGTDFSEVEMLGPPESPPRRPAGRQLP